MTALDDTPLPTRVTVTGGSFDVAFGEGDDRATIADAQGWIADELRTSEGTCADVRDEAHRLIDLAVATGRYPGYVPTESAAECKRHLTSRYKAATTTHHPRWQSGRRRSRFGGDPERSGAE